MPALNCEWCGQVFEARRRTARYYSAYHRLAAHRARRTEDAEADTAEPVHYPTAADIRAQASKTADAIAELRRRIEDGSAHESA